MIGIMRSQSDVLGQQQSLRRTIWSSMKQTAEIGFLMLFILCIYTLLCICTNIELILGVENMAAYSTRNTAWDLANPFSLPQVSNQPFPLYKALDYICVA